MSTRRRCRPPKTVRVHASTEASPETEPLAGAVAALPKVARQGVPAGGNPTSGSEDGLTKISFTPSTFYRGGKEVAVGLRVLHLISYYTITDFGATRLAHKPTLVLVPYMFTWMYHELSAVMHVQSCAVMHECSSRSHVWILSSTPTDMHVEKKSTTNHAC